MVHLSKTLERFEKLVSEGKIDSFVIYIEPTGFKLEAEGELAPQKCEISERNMNTIRTFFGGVNRIQYSTFDYANLLCTLRA
ncbi:hypothetical protein [uncultured Pontibacter sp.]|uniref:hypothetical protein n=1 Tax=uncultured Pontibacter sp. TaxID=453356 RepID=UPI00262A6911|nr:hypothetical protein [uncultured Pontibacter sp.]